MAESWRPGAGTGGRESETGVIVGVLASSMRT